MESVCLHGTLYTNVHGNIMNLIHNSYKWEQPEWPANEWTNRMWSIHAMWHYLAIQRRWTLKCYAEGKKSHTKDYCMIPFMLKGQPRYTHRDQVDLWFSGARQGQIRMYCQCTQGIFEGWWGYSETSGDGCTTLWPHQKHLTVCFQNMCTILQLSWEREEERGFSGQGRRWECGATAYHSGRGTSRA